MSILENIFKVVGVTAAVWASSPAERFDHLSINVVDENLNRYVQQQKRQASTWFAYQVPARQGQHSMCCYNKGKKTICDLSQTQYGYGSSSDSPTTDHINVFVHMEQGQVSNIMPVGDHCEVKADGVTVDWLTDVSSRQSIDWLAAQIRNTQAGDEHGSLYTLGLHEDSHAADTLYDLVIEDAGDYSEQSVFWLGQRQADGFGYLNTLFQELPVGELRRKINFALSQNRSSAANDLLKSIAQHDQDTEQQADAIFWLSQTDGVDDLPAFLIDLMSETDSHAVKEKAIFSLSQIDSDAASDALADLVDHHADREVREKALFWLTQNDPQKAQKAAMALLESGSGRSEMENAVFTLSQLPDEQSADALFGIIKGDYSREVKKKALFWLSQSDDPKTLDQLEDLL